MKRFLPNLFWQEQVLFSDQHANANNSQSRRDLYIRMYESILLLPASELNKLCPLL